MATSELKSERTIRPRVLAAVLRLQRFTVQEVVFTAGLKDAKQAYVQLSKLEKEGFLKSSPHRTPQSSRAINIYVLVKDRDKEADLIASATNYGLAIPASQSSSLFRDAISAASKVLDFVDAKITGMSVLQASEDKLRHFSSEISHLISQLEDVELDIQTAKSEESGSAAEMETQLIRHRLLAVRATVSEVKSSLLRRHSALIIKKVASKWDEDVSETTPEWLRKTLTASGRKLSNEIACDLLAPAIHRRDMMPLLLTSHAMRTYDLKLIHYCLDRYRSQKHSHWWQYNLLSIDFLLGRFKQVYANIQDALASVASKPSRRLVIPSCRIFLYDADRLTQEALSPLLSKYEVSLVSPSALNYWNWTENVICPVLVEPMSERGGPLTGTVLLRNDQEEGPMWKLFAYGPLSSAIERWPGAPALRVAASMQDLLHVNFEIRLVVDALRNRKGVIVIQDHQSKEAESIDSDVRSALHSCEELAFTAHS